MNTALAPRNEAAGFASTEERGDGVIVRVRVPASSANLGPGFDALGLALARYDELDAEVTSGGLSVQVVGEGVHTLPLDETHLVVRAFRAAAAALDFHPPGLY